MTLNSIDDLKIAVIGLGYVGLPLAVELGKSRPVVGLLNLCGIYSILKKTGHFRYQ